MNPPTARLLRATFGWALILASLASTQGLAQESPLKFSDQTDAAGFEGVRTRTYAAAAADYDRDGFPDLFVSNHEAKPTLHRNRGDGTFENMTSAGDFARGDIHGITWVDLDVDGFLDLFVVIGAGRGRGVGDNRYYRNRDGTWFDKIEIGDVLAYGTGRARTSVPWDVDRDGQLDMILMNHHQKDRESRIALRRGMTYEDAGTETGWQDVKAGCVTIFHPDDLAEPLYVVSTEGNDAGRAYRRDASGRFVDVTYDIGLAHHWSVNAVAPGDYDLDGDLDLYVVRGPYIKRVGAEVVDRTLCFMFFAQPAGQYKEARFKGEGAIVADLMVEESRRKDKVWLGGGRTPVDKLPWEGSVDDAILQGNPEVDPEVDRGLYLWRDENGELVLSYVGEPGVLGGVGGEVHFQSRVELVSVDGIKPDDLKGIGNRLYRNDGGRFVDVTEEAGVADMGMGIDAVFADVDNDLDQDLYVVNGGLAFKNPTNRFFRNLGNGTFREETLEAGLTGSELGRSGSILSFDYDQDGDLDFFGTNGRGPHPRSHGPYTLLRNDSEVGNWCRLDLESTVSNPAGMGAMVYVNCEGRTLLLERFAATGRFSTSHLPFHIGMGEASQVEVTVRWPSGRHATRAIAHGEKVTMREPDVDNAPRSYEETMYEPGGFPWIAAVLGMVVAVLAALFVVWRQSVSQS